MSSRSNDDERVDPVVGVDLDDAKDLGVERLGPLIAAREAGTVEDEALPAGRNDGRRYVLDPDVGDRPHVRDLGFPSAVGRRRPRPDGDRHWKMSSASISAMRVPVAGREIRQEAFGHLACRVFQPPRLLAAVPQTARARRPGLPRRIFRSG